ncbi:MAG: RNA polymerase-binding protein DksA [Burkholderiaceae bacterium]
MPAKKTTAPAKAKAKTVAKVAVKAPAKKAVPAKAAPKSAAKSLSPKKPASKAKPVVAKKPVTAKPAAKKALVKPVAAKKSPPKKTVASKSAASKTVAKAPAKKAPVKKVVAKKVTAKKAVDKKPVAKKTSAKTPVKKQAPAKAQASKSSKQPATKAIAKKPAVKAAPAKAAAPKAEAKPVTPKATKPQAVAAAPGAPAAEAKKPGRKRTNNKPIAPSMSDADLTPAHAPDAAKATFIQDHTPVMTVTVPAPIKKDPKRANNWKTKALADLTDEDILAMPDSEYMNDVQVAFFRARLVTLKNDMLANAGQTTENLREDTVVVPDPADRATIEEEHALELRTRDRERKLLKKIQQSIMAIDSGEYGFCDETGEPIGVGRLLARPTASLSLEAQQRRELKQKLYGD